MILVIKNMEKRKDLHLNFTAHVTCCVLLNDVGLHLLPGLAPNCTVWSSCQLF